MAEPLEPTVDCVARLQVERDAWRAAFASVVNELVMHDMAISKVYALVDRARTAMTNQLQHGYITREAGAIQVVQTSMQRVEHSIEWWHLTSAHQAAQKTQAAMDALDPPVGEDAADPTGDPVL